MKINLSLLFILLAMYSCVDNNEKIAASTPKVGLFSRYLNETFNTNFEDTNQYYIIIGKRICGLCEEGTLSAFKLQQNKISSKNLILITDFKKVDIDTLLNDNFQPKILIDSMGNFENYLFPRSYITIYKIQDGKVENYAFFSKDKKLNQFLAEETISKTK